MLARPETRFSENKLFVQVGPHTKLELTAVPLSRLFSGQILTREATQTVRSPPTPPPAAGANYTVGAGDADRPDRRAFFQAAAVADQRRLVQLHVRLDLAARPDPDIPIRLLGPGDVHLDLALEHVQMRAAVFVQAA